MSWTVVKAALHLFATEMLWEALGFWSLAATIMFAAIAGGMRHSSGRAKIVVVAALIVTFLTLNVGWCYAVFRGAPGVEPHAVACAAIVGIGVPGGLAAAVIGMLLLVLLRTHIPVVR